MSFQKIFLGFFISLIALSATSQSDLSAWIGVETKYSVNKKWSLGLEAQSRSDLKLGRLNGLFVSPSLSWKPIKFLEVGLSYRLTSVPFSESTTNRVVKNRMTLDLTFQKIEELFVDKSRLSVSLRLRGTTEFQLEKRTENTLRLNTKLEYDIPNAKLDLSASAELFYRFQRDLTYTFTEVTATNAINRLRFKFGMSYPLSERQKIELCAIEQLSYPDGIPEFIIGIGYIYDFSPKKKAKGE